MELSKQLKIIQRKGGFDRLFDEAFPGQRGVYGSRHDLACRQLDAIQFAASAKEITVYDYLEKHPQELLNLLELVGLLDSNYSSQTGHRVPTE